MSVITDGGDTTSPLTFTPWKKHFAWKPVYIRGDRYWLTTVYVRNVEIETPNSVSSFGTTVEYARSKTIVLVEHGTLLDVIKENYGS